MPLQLLGELSFDSPAAWADRTLLAFEGAPLAPDEPGPRITVTREARLPTDALRPHVERRARALVAESGFTLLETADLDLAGRHAIRAWFSSASPMGPIEHVVVYVESSSKDRSLFVFTCTTLLGRMQRGGLDALASVLQSVRFDVPPKVGASNAQAQGEAQHPFVFARKAPVDYGIPAVPMPGRPSR